ncbi:MAG: RnfABCDGE type electron transport complex subunit D [Pirellulales bacterium]
MNSGPYIHSGSTTRALMVQATVALAPILAAAVWRYGTHAMVLIVSAVVAACAVDALCDRRRALDGSALVAGAIFACLLPGNAPWWIAALGGIITITLGKHWYGGLGQNPFNPAALARALLMGLLPAYFFAPRWTVDGVTSATPLAKEIDSVAPAVADLFFGRHAGTLGEAMPLAILIGGVVLLVLKTIDWRIPLCYLASLSLLALLLPAGDRMDGHAPWLAGNPLVHLFGGGSLFAAFFMLTDPVTSPFTLAGRVTYALLAALYTMLVRFYTPYPDGVVLAVLLANASVPLIDRYANRLRQNTVLQDQRRPADKPSGSSTGYESQE